MTPHSGRSAGSARDQPRARVAKSTVRTHHGVVPQDLSAVGWPLLTERLLIRPATVGDLDKIWPIRRLPSVANWMTSGADDRDEFATAFTDPERLARTLVVELDGVLIGDLMLTIDDAWAQTEVADRARGVQAELGWTIDPVHAGRGFATEAAAALLRVCFEQLGLRRAYAQCFADNAASWRVMEKLGMRREEYAVRDSLHRSGVWMDGMRYAILADEWRAAQAAR